MKIESTTHFGLEIRPRTRGFRLTRDNYVTLTNRSTFGRDEYYIKALESKDNEILKTYADVYADSEGRIYTDAQCKKFFDEAMMNYDLNIAYYSRLDRNKFNYQIDRFERETKFSFIKDLNCFQCPGYYALVLDDYCQVYIGTAKNIRDRVRQHWTGGKMRLDRLVCGNVISSRLSIDSFRSLDTTRILAYKAQETYSSEDQYINRFSDEFICNRASGGRNLSADPFSIEMISRYKVRMLESFDDV